jgi:hypothetical protein
VEVQLGAGEEEATGEEVDGQRVERENRDEQKRPAKEPRTSALARRRRHRLRFRSAGQQGATAWRWMEGKVGLRLLSPGDHRYRGEDGPIRPRQLVFFLIFFISPDFETNPRYLPAQ